MSVSNKIRAMLNLAEKKPADLAECLGISVQAVRNKFTRDTFSVSDLVNIAHFLGWEISFTSSDGQSIQLTQSDISKPALKNGSGEV